MVVWLLDRKMLAERHDCRVEKKLLNSLYTEAKNRRRTSKKGNRDKTESIKLFPHNLYRHTQKRTLLIS